MPKTGKMPDFIIAGIYKAGTTSLFVNLPKHPQIEMSPNAFKYAQLGVMNMKESHFFDERWERGIDWYRSLFNDNDKLQGEAASVYLFEEEYIKRMSAMVPDAKIIVALRDPVTRAYSQFNDLKQRLRNSISSISARLEGDKEAHQRMIRSFRSNFDETIKKEIDHGLRAGQGMIGKGLYIDFIEDLFKYYPRQQVHILISEQMKRDMQGTYDQIFDFLALEKVKIDFDMNVLVGEYEKPMSPWALGSLKEIYGRYNERLFDLLGYKVPEWDTR